MNGVKVKKRNLLMRKLIKKLYKKAICISISVRKLPQFLCSCTRQIYFFLVFA